MSQLVTGDAVVLDLRTAGVPSRVLATLVDALVQGALLLLLMFLVGVFASNGSSAAAAALVFVALLVPGLAYPVAMETLLSGRTLGKLALGLRVVRDDGGPIGFRQAITRGLIGLFAEKPGVTLGCAAVITSLLNERGKRLGDLAAGTVVVQVRVVSPKADLVEMPPQLASWATSLDLSSLPDDLAMSARGYLSRMGSLTPAAREDLGSRLAAAVAAVVTPEPPPGVPAWAYLSAVLAERRRRAQESVAYGVTVAPVAPPSLAGFPPAAAPPDQAPAPPTGPFAPPA